MLQTQNKTKHNLCIAAASNNNINPLDKAKPAEL